MHTCTKCGEDKERNLDNFPPAGQNSDGMAGDCRDCRREYTRAKSKEWRAKYPERYKENNKRFREKHPDYLKDRAKSIPDYYRKVHLRKRYKITIDEYTSIAESQEGKCLICLNPARLVVDHCHKTNEVRGLVCTQCNVGIGFFKDNPVALRAAADYLERKLKE